jgi:hypothetical protein
VISIFKKAPKITFYPLVRGLEKVIPILPARNVLPGWWRDIRVSETFQSLAGYPITQGNIKKCPAVIDILTAGWVMPLWTDLYLKVSKSEISYRPADTSFEFSVHPHTHFIDVMPDQLKNKYFCVFKPFAPWIVKTSPGYSIFNMDPFYHFSPYFDTAAGIQDSDVYYDLNPILFIKKEGEYVIPRGTPLSVIIPFKREKIEGCVEPYSEKVEDLVSEERLITNTMFSSAKSYNEIRRRKCPFQH